MISCARLNGVDMPCWRKGLQLDVSCEVLVSSHRDDALWCGDFQAQVVVVGDGAEGVERGSAEGGIVLVRHLDDIECDDFSSGCEVVAKRDGQVDLTQGRNGLSAEAYEGYARR